MADAPKILGTDTLRQAYPKLNSAIDNSNEALKKSDNAVNSANTAISEAQRLGNEAKSTANAAETKADSVQEQFNQVVIEGDSSVEAAQARVKADGTSFATLQERLNTSDAQLAQSLKFENQTNFVDVLKKMNTYKRMRVVKPPTVTPTYTIILDDGYNYVEYEFIKDNNDDFIKFNKGCIGTLEREKNVSKATNLTLSWNTANLPNAYTTTIGATFTATAKGSELHLRHYANPQGGLWEFTIDGNESHKYLVSTYAHETLGYVESLIAKGLTDAEHTIVGTFKGNDPKFPAVGGVPRGWVYLHDTSTTVNSVIGYGNATQVQQAELLATSSNKELAFQVRQGSGATHWIPDHGTGTAFNATSPVFLIEGKATDMSQLNKPIESSSFKLIQTIYGKLPYTNNLLKMTIETSISLDGVVAFICSLEAVESFWISNGYPAMLPALGTVLNEFVTGIGNSKVNKADESQESFAEESNRTHSVVAVSSDNKNWFSALQLDALGKSMRLGKPGSSDEDYSMFLWNRAENPKTYFRSYQSYQVPVGEKYSWSSRFLVGKINNVYDFVKS